MKRSFAIAAKDASGGLVEARTLGEALARCGVRCFDIVAAVDMGITHGPRSLHERRPPVTVIIGRPPQKGASAT